jgi:hypothetical protein
VRFCTSPDDHALGELLGVVADGEHLGTYALLRLREHCHDGLRDIA